MACNYISNLVDINLKAGSIGEREDSCSPVSVQRWMYMQLYISEFRNVQTLLSRGLMQCDIFISEPPTLLFNPKSGMSMKNSYMHMQIPRVFEIYRQNSNNKF